MKAASDVLLIEESSAFRGECSRLRENGALAFVPTMGALHDGHIALMRRARQLAESVVVSIFVNPTQFGPNEDLQSYPRTLEADLERCEAAGVNVVFCPTQGQMYLPRERTRVRVSELTRGLCGAARPGHFDGVCTVVCKLLMLVGECTAVFGRKDYQQLKVVERMCRDLFLPAVIDACPTVREADGLALSSRNRRLNPEERARALSVVRGLRAAAAAFGRGVRDVHELEGLCRRELALGQLREDYVSCVDPDELGVWTDGTAGERALLAVAAFSGNTRLIDNVVLGEADDMAALGPGA